MKAKRKYYKGRCSEESEAMNEHDICREELKLEMESVRRKFTPEQIKAAWAWSDGSGRNATFEFHGPDNYYTVVSRACCLWSAKAGGWSKLMDKKFGE